MREASVHSCPSCGTLLPESVSALLCPVCALEESGEEGFENTQALGNYTLLGEIARGGMGVVYLARQESLRRQVAVKILPGAAFSSQEFRQRFQREAETAASLSHPGIVAIHEVGDHLGQPFIAMELVEGPSLLDRLQTGRMMPELAAHIVRQVGLAVAHAHERGVIHRDLKPSNILLREETEPVLTDFGLARFTQSGHTLTRGTQSLGSPGYLPPERVGSSEVAPSVAEDVYGLGAVLYHCLTGRPPFTADTVASLLAATQTLDPVLPQSLNPSLPLDLQTICLRCLEKNPTARYATALEVSAELDRYLRGEPILARPVGAITRVVRRAQRQPVLAALSLALLLAVLSGTTVSIIGWRRAAQEAETRRIELYSSDVAAAGAALAAGHPAQARALLDEAVPVAGEDDLRGSEWHLLQQLLKPLELDSVQAHSHILTALAWSADGRQLLSGAHDGSLKLWSVQKDRRLVLKSQVSESRLPRLHQVEWLSEDTFITAEESLWIRCRKLGQDAPLWQVSGRQFALARGASLLAVSSAGPFFYEPTGAVTLWRLGVAEPQKMATLPGQIRQVALSANGRYLAMSQAQKGGVDVENGVLLRDLQEKTSQTLQTAGPVWTLKFSPDAQQLAITLFQGGLQVLRYATADGRPLPALTGHALRPWSVVFTSDSSQIITTSSDRSLRSWSDEKAVGQVSSAHENEVWCAALHPDGRLLASGDKDGALKLFPFPLPQPRLKTFPRFPHFRYAPLLFSADSQAVLTQNQGRITASSLSVTQSKKAPPPQPILGHDFEGKAWRWEESKGSFISLAASPRHWKISDSQGLATAPLHVGLVSGGRHAFAVHAPGTALRLDLLTGQTDTVSALFEQPLATKDQLKAAALSPDGRYLAIASWHELVLYDFQGHSSRRFSNDPHWARDIAFSPDSRLMATAGINGHILLRSLPDGAIIATLKGHLEEASGVTFSPDGRTLVSCEIGLGLRFWRLDTLREVLHLPLPDTAESVRFSADGRWLAVGLCRPGWGPEKGEVLVLPCGR